MDLKFRIIGEGQPLVLMHGLFGMSDNLTSFAKLLAEQGYAVYVTDLRNHGHSPHHEIHNYPSMAADVAQLIRDNNLQQPVVIGHSMGGKVAMQLANDFPEISGAVVVIDIAPYYYPVHHREILDALLSVDLDTVKTRSEAEAVLKQSIHDFGTLQFLLKNLYWKEEKLGWRFNLHAINNQIEAIGEATWPATINAVPVCFIRGSKSKYIDPYREAEILEHFPNAKFATVEGAGHWVHAEKPQELLSAVTAYLNSLSN
jgi:pimeloyl-ACP methyl ester carboxylesterase